MEGGRHSAPVAVTVAVTDADAVEVVVVATIPAAVTTADRAVHRSGGGCRLPPAVIATTIPCRGGGCCCRVTAGRAQRTD